MFLFSLSCLASIRVLCHTSAAIFSDRKPPICAVQYWGFNHRERNPLAMVVKGLYICTSLSGNLIKVMCKAPAIWIEDTYILLKLSQCFFSFLIPNSFVLQSGWQNSRKTFTTLFCNKCNLSHRWINKKIDKRFCVSLCDFFKIHTEHKNDRCQNENVSI